MKVPAVMPPPSGTHALPGLQSAAVMQPATQIDALLPPLPRQMPRPSSHTNVPITVSGAVAHSYSPHVPPFRQRPTSDVQSLFESHGSPVVAVLASYLNALEGKGVHVVTVNDYLAKFQSEQMGRIHHFLGLEVGAILSAMTPAERRQQYACSCAMAMNR